MESNAKNKSVIIIGGGVAGMAAAETLNDSGVNVHLIEKNDHLGGNTFSWACMATGSCRHCSACLSHEMADKLHRMTCVNTHLNSEILEIDKNQKKYTVRLKGDLDQSIETDKIILATGFTPINPDGLIGEIHKKNKYVITTVELNHILKNNAIGEYFPDTSCPKIGFIQCVGSRNREKGRDYCSQVCCKISLRHINKLMHLYPGAKISLFYIDLQVIGKEIRAEFDSLSDNVDLIQGVPIEIFNNKMDKKLSVIREDDESGSRIADHFDMMVLSVGIAAHENTTGLMGKLKISSDQWGFINDKSLPARKDIYVAGCAAGPVDILTAKQQGINCAKKIIQCFNPEKPGRAKGLIAIIGDGNEARKTASAALNEGYDVWMFGLSNKKESPKKGIHYIHDTKLISVKGAAGNFAVLYKNSQKLKQENFTAIIVAEPVKTSPAGQKTNLTPDVLYSLEDFSNILEKNPEDIPAAIVFWLDYSKPEFKTFSRKALVHAIELAKAGKQVSFIMNKMLVHGLSGQKLYDKARKLGIKFLRTASPGDVSVKKENGKILFDLKEKILKNLIISFESDWLIIPEHISPSKQNPMIAALLKENIDVEGYLQSANVRHRLTNSPRKGIFYTGSCHDETDDQDQNIEIEIILSSINDIACKKTMGLSCGIEINTKKCRKCLTCFRACPHGAIVLNADMKPYIVPEACFSCGLCLSSCPALAIESKEFSDESYINSASEDKVIIFACERSGALAAGPIEKNLRVNIQKVPCVCRISKNILMKTLEKGAEKIILAGCHTDNCRSLKGSQTAQTRAKILGRLPGINDSNIIFYPVAANESKKFEQFLAQEVLSK
ncbi:MAG: FAD-dependent oxidoreductase [Deltaproteobacteria bacterium]|nr:FAD-dependent oxidoreductase [Deltaproteobacteria bacterium]